LSLKNEEKLRSAMKYSIWFAYWLPEATGESSKSIAFLQIERFLPANLKSSQKNSPLFTIASDETSQWHFTDTCCCEYAFSRAWASHCRRALSQTKTYQLHHTSRNPGPASTVDAHNSKCPPSSLLYALQHGA
jgi:hypothetical protein